MLFIFKKNYKKYNIIFLLIVLFFNFNYQILAQENEIKYPNYDRPHEISGKKYCYFPGSHRKKDFYAIKGAPKKPCERQEEWMTTKQILENKMDQNIKNYIAKNNGEEDEFIYKCIHNGTTIKDEVDLLASGKQDLIAMNLSTLKEHLQKNPEDSYFFFNPKADLSDVSQLEFGLCACEVKNSDYIPKIKDKELKETIMDDAHKHLINKDILTCHLNDAKNAEYALVLVDLPKDIMKLSETIRNKIEIMLKKPDQLKKIEIKKDPDNKGKLKLKKPLNQNKDTIKGFKLDFTNDNQLKIFGILENDSNLILIDKFDIHNEHHLTFNLIKNSFTPDKNLFAGTKEEIEPQRNFPDEASIDFVNSYQTLSDAALFITYSFETVQDTIQCFFNKIGIIKNGTFFNCEHASVPYVIYNFVDEKLAAKIKEEEKQKIYLLEKQKEREAEITKKTKTEKILGATGAVCKGVFEGIDKVLPDEKTMGALIIGVGLTIGVGILSGGLVWI